MVGGDIAPGSKCSVTRDIVIGNKTAFRKGETVVVEMVQPNRQRPEYKYVVLSGALGMRYQLSDGDLAPLRAGPVGPPGQPRFAEAPSPVRRSVYRKYLAVGAAVVAVAALAAVLLFVFLGNGSPGASATFEKFYSSLQKGDYAAAHSLLTEDLKEYIDVEALELSVKSMELPDVEIISSEENGESATIVYEEIGTGNSYQGELAMENGVWKVETFWQPARK